MSMKKYKQEKRPSSDDFVELHVFVVPYELWMEKYRTAYNSSTLESISAGFVRVPPHLTLGNLRFQIKEQLSYGDVLPEEYVFLRSVGRCLAIVNKVQELSLKVKHFLPPVVTSPEIFVLFGNHNSLSHTLSSSVNAASDLPEYETARGYLTYSREMGENSSCSLPERGKTEQFDQTDALERRVHFQQSDESKNEISDHSERTISGNLVGKVEGTYLTEFPPATKTKSWTSEEQQLSRRLSNSAQDNQKSSNANQQISSELPMDQNVQHTQANPDEVNGIQSHVNTKENREESRDTTQVSSSFEAQHVKSPRNKVRRKNHLLHSKTAPSLLQNSYSQNYDKEDEGSEQNERITEMISGNDENSGICNNKKETVNDRSKEYPHHLELNNKSESETMHKKRDDYEIPGDLESDGSKNNYQMKSANENGNNFEDTKVVDLTNENIKHSAEHSVASSGFESLDQSNNNVNRQDIEHNEKDYGVTIADKENLVLQLQAELNAVRSERSNSEKAREQLLKKAKNLQNQNNQKRNQAKSVWKKRYFEEKKKTVSLEERCNQLRYEVEVIHKRILSSDDSKDRDSATAYLNKDGDPKKLNAKIMLTRKENEVEELRRRVEEAKIKLGSEMKLRDNAQKELKQIRDEVIDKKINATLVKKSLSLLETRPTDT